MEKKSDYTYFETNEIIKCSKKEKLMSNQKD